VIEDHQLSAASGIEQYWLGLEAGLELGEAEMAKQSD
jgi:hypothetical protein